MIQTIERPNSLVWQVLTALRKEIEDGNYPPSSRLPAEQVLAAQLGVSRPVVREAISQLKADGILTTRKGSGAYVSPNPAGNVFRLPLVDQAETDLEYLFELRFWTEIAAAEMAAIRRTPEDLEKMAQAIEQMKSSTSDFKAASAADVALHHAIAGATRNPYLVAFTDFVGGQLLQTREIAWKNSASFAGGPNAALQEHQAIYDAIADGDSRAAGRAARSHLLRAAGRMCLDVMDLEKNGKP